MTKDEILVQVKNAVMDVLPEISSDDITPDKSLVDLGANSIDRSEIILQSMMDVGVKASLVEVGTIKKIDDLVNFYYSKLEAK
jgi:polyketide biosynthesis acyl carrier protein